MFLLTVILYLVIRGVGAGRVEREWGSPKEYLKDSRSIEQTNLDILDYFGRQKSILQEFEPSRVAQSVGHLTRKSGVLGSIPGLATYFRFSFRFFKKGSCQLLAKVCARSTG